MDATVVEQCSCAEQRAPPPTPHAHGQLYRNSPRAKSGVRAKASGGQRILKMQGSEEWESFFCEPFTSYWSQPWLWQEWVGEGRNLNTGQQIIPTLRSGATSHYITRFCWHQSEKYSECLPFYIVSLPLLHPNIDNQELTLIKRRIIKILFSLPLWCHVGGDVFTWGLEKHRWSQPWYGAIPVLAMVPLQHPVRTLGFRLRVPRPTVKNVVFLLRLFYFCNSYL